MKYDILKLNVEKYLEGNKGNWGWEITLNELEEAQAIGKIKNKAEAFILAGKIISSFDAPQPLSRGLLRVDTERRLFPRPKRRGLGAAERINFTVFI